MSTSHMLHWIDAQSGAMLEQVIRLASINSGSENMEGLTRVAGELAPRLARLGEVERIDLPPREVIDAAGNVEIKPLGQALRCRCRRRGQPAAMGRRVFLGIHYDTVYGHDHPFQQCERLDANTLRGPGVCDAKGGIVVMLTALEAFERSELAERVQWEVLLNPDEEIGSPGSAGLLAEAAGRNDIGLVFEPALEGGAMAAGRKGSGNFTIVLRGKSAHVGRNPQDGRNAIHAAAELVATLTRRAEHLEGVTLNVGRIDGGGPVNIVPDLAVIRLNVRVRDCRQQGEMLDMLHTTAMGVGSHMGVAVRLVGSFHNPPKPLDGPTNGLLALIADCGRRLGLDLRWRDTGGVCDGNKLAAAGLPTVDTLGPRGGRIHSDQEYLQIDSLAERAKLAALVLAQLAGAGAAAAAADAPTAAAAGNAAAGEKP